MAIPALPESGFVLSPPAPGDDFSNSSRIPQVIQLELDDGLLHDIIKASRHGKNSLLSFGKTVSLHYGSKSRLLASRPSLHPSYVYDQSDSDTEAASLTGQLSHRLFLQKAQEQLLEVDDALTTLQSSLASAQHVKESNQITFLPNSSSLAPKAKQKALGHKQQSTRRDATSALGHSRSSSQQEASVSRSMSSTPSNGPFRPPVYVKREVIAAQAKNHRLAALRTPVIHLLATAPLSIQELSSKLRGKGDEISEVVAKVGKPTDDKSNKSKWRLKDSAFKDLDVWPFKYATQGERDQAIDHAVSALDRMRVSALDPIFQKLLPRAERNKGKTLSRLNHLHKGPIAQSNTPKIHVQQPDESHKVSSGTESDRKRKAPHDSADSTASTKSKGSAKKSKPSDTTTQAKASSSTARKTLPSEAEEKDAKTVIKKPGVPLSKEFVNDSDEEDGLEASMAAQSKEHMARSEAVRKAGADKPHPSSSKAAKPKANSKPEQASNSLDKTGSGEAGRVASKAGKQHAPSRAGRHKATTHGQSPADPPKKRNRPAQKAPGEETESKPPVSVKGDSQHGVNSGSASSSTPSSRPRNLSSPHKPSPLGSSPPTNASEMADGENTSASSTPHIESKSGDNATKLNGIGDHQRKASDHSLKRKANDVDSSIHDHTDLAGGTDIKGSGLEPLRARKRSRADELTPPPSDGSSPTSSGPVKAEILKMIESFEQHEYPEYAEAYRQAERDRLPDQIRRVEKMHHRLVKVKERISQEVRRHWL